MSIGRTAICHVAAAGRLAADQTFTDGGHSLLCNGRDAAGRSMPSGTYFVRLETESSLLTALYLPALPVGL